MHQLWVIKKTPHAILCLLISVTWFSRRTQVLISIVTKMVGAPSAWNLKLLCEAEYPVNL